MRNGACVPDNTFYQVEELRLKKNGLKCFLASGDNVVTSAHVNWLYPDCNLVGCFQNIETSNEIVCSSATNNNGAILYISNSVIDRTWPPEYSGLYTCCLPGNCSDGGSNSITVRIFGWCLLYQ